MKLTCVTATFNCIKAGNRERLVRCIESVAKLKTEHEHLIYDGASTDGTVELLRELEAKTPGLKVVSEPDMGIYNALNKGVRDAQGEWFYVLGADDYISHAEVMDDILENVDVETAMVVSPVMTSGGSCIFDKLERLKTILIYSIYCHQGTLMRSSIIKKEGGFDERFPIGADWDLILRLHNKALPIKYVFNIYATFANGGVSDNGGGTKDSIIFHAQNLHISIAQMEYAREYWRVPLFKILRFLRHEDYAFRLSAKWLLCNWLKFYLRIVLYPLVLIRRGIRTYRKSI